MRRASNARHIYVTSSGVTLTLIAQPEDRRDPVLSTMAWESIISTVTTEPPHNASDTGPVTAAVALRAVLPKLTH